MLHTQIPFVTGGAEVLVTGLVDALQQRGHTAEVVALPIRWNPPDKLLGTALAWRMLDLTEVAGEKIDLVICTKFPTWAINHPNKVLWLIHQHRQAYDLYGSPFSEFGPHAPDQHLRSAIFQIDRAGISECKRRYAISRNVASRLREFLGIESEPLYPPVEDRDLWPESYEPFILSVARLDPLKRIESLVEAWPQVDDRLRLKITSVGPMRPYLEERARALGASDRIDFLGRVDDDELASLFRTCRAVYYAPIDEDYGYTAVEAMSAGKPVVTAADSGGVLEFVRDEETGLVSPLDGPSLAASVNRYLDEDLARKHGGEGTTVVSDISWDHVVTTLLGELAP
ncbi:MAG: glycosyltransferase family 4 protein [Thermomicrobiales bacterium]